MGKSKSLRWIGRIDPRERIVRLWRLTWWKGTPGYDGGHSTKFTLALSAKPFGFSRGWREWILTVFCLRLHWQRSYGGAHPL